MLTLGLTDSELCWQDPHGDKAVSDPLTYHNSRTRYRSEPRRALIRAQTRSDKTPWRVPCSTNSLLGAPAGLVNYDGHGKLSIPGWDRAAGLVHRLRHEAVPGGGKLQDPAYAGK